MRYALVAFLIAGPLPAGQPSTVLLNNASGQNQAFAAVGRVRATYQCTGSLLRPDQATDASPAYVLTAGHCIGLEPYGVITDRAVNFRVEFNYFVDTRDRVIAVSARRVVWSTMKGVDLALIELDASLGDLRAKGLDGFRLAPGAAPPGAPIYWAGAPTGTIPDGRTYLRRGECTAQGSTTLIEGRWLWHEELRTDCEDVYPGASGSPLFDKNSNAIAGVIGTGTLLSYNGGPDYDCFQNRPCAVTADGPVVEPDTSYASPVVALRACFDGAARFNLALADCPLDRGEQLAIDIGPRNAARPTTDGQPARWNARLAGAFAYYAWKQVRLGQGDCREPGGYSVPVALAAAPVIASPIGADEGHYLLCVVAGNAPAVDASWQPFRHASIRRMRLDAQPPVAVPDYSIERLEGGYRLAFIDSAPAIANSEIKSGPLAATNCDDPAGYRIMLSVLPLVRRSDFPFRICVRYADDAGNAAPPLVFDFGPPALQPYGLRNGASLARASSVAPGSLFRVDALELTDRGEWSATPAATLGGVRLEVTDGAGATHSAPLMQVDPDFVEALLPGAAESGAASLKVVSPDGVALSTNFTIAQSSPGIFTANMAGFGPALGYFAKPGLAATTLGVCRESVYCSFQPVPIGGDAVDLVVYGTGFARDAKSVRVGTEEAPVTFVGTSGAFAGVGEIRFRLPPSFPLRGYQRVQAGAAAVWIQLE